MSPSACSRRNAGDGRRSPSLKPITSARRLRPRVAISLKRRVCSASAARTSTRSWRDMGRGKRRKGEKVKGKRRQATGGCVLLFTVSPFNLLTPVAADAPAFHLGREDEE